MGNFPFAVLEDEDIPKGGLLEMNLLLEKPKTFLLELAPNEMEDKNNSSFA